MDRLLIIDGHNLLFQMFFGMPNSILSLRGNEIRGVVGFIGAVNKLIDANKPTHMVVIFDGERCNPRNEILEEYKANRPDYSDVSDEENPFTQLPYIYKALDYMGIKHAETTVCETDDVIASYAIRYGKECEIIISSFDSDYFQLINEMVRVVRYRGKNSVTCDEGFIIGRYGITPSKYLDFKCLVGDNSDNIKGVKGVGPKTAAKLINTFGSLDELMKRKAEINNVRVRESVSESEDILIRNLALIRLSGDADIPFTLSETRFDNPKIKTMDVMRAINA